ncbi:MAG TPA: winged helix-turn-helix domain-containing protein [Acidobacteriota bacterium]|nr:winged helix-turn-helix domain-containing protein [Acidobacteriota bacterium]
MKKDNFVFLNLGDSSATEVTQAISSKTGQRIIEYLKDKSATETQIAADLSIPGSTVHYNIAQLVKAGIVVAEEYHYSAKGREVNHYKLTEKFIVIIPAKTPASEQLMRALVPATLLALWGTAFVTYITRTLSAPAQIAPMALKTAGEEAASASLSMMADVGQTAAVAHPPYALWFIITSIILIAMYLVVERLRIKSQR